MTLTSGWKSYHRRIPQRQQRIRQLIVIDVALFQPYCGHASPYVA